jgi:hypothetical protein
MATPGRNTKAWRMIVAGLRQTETHCWRCGEPLRPDLKFPHPLSTTGGHIIAIEDAPELADVPSNVRAEHLRCNSADGAHRTNLKRRGQTGRELVTSPDWT